MEGIPVELTEREIELGELYEQAIENEEFAKALTFIDELIEIRKENPVYYFWQGGCYRVLGQFDNALDSYRKSLYFEGKVYIVGENLSENAERYIRGLELIKKIYESFQKEKYKVCIKYIDEFMKIHSSFGDMYVMRGCCNDLLGNRVLALADYGRSLNLKLSEHLIPIRESQIKPKIIKDQRLVSNEVEYDKSCDGVSIVRA